MFCSSVGCRGGSGDSVAVSMRMVDDSRSVVVLSAVGELGWEDSLTSQSVSLSDERPLDGSRVDI